MFKLCWVENYSGLRENADSRVSQGRVERQRENPGGGETKQLQLFACLCFPDLGCPSSLRFCYCCPRDLFLDHCETASHLHLSTATRVVFLGYSLTMSLSFLETWDDFPWPRRQVKHFSLGRSPGPPVQPRTLFSHACPPRPTPPRPTRTQTRLWSSFR